MITHTNFRCQHICLKGKNKGKRCSNYTSFIDGSISYCSIHLRREHKENMEIKYIDKIEK